MLPRRAIVLAIIERGQARGEIRADIDPEAALDLMPVRSWLVESRVEARIQMLASEGRIKESSAAPGRWMIA